MNRDNLIEELKKGIEEAFPENIDLDADDLETIGGEGGVVEKVLDQATEAMDDTDDEGEAQKG